MQLSKLNTDINERWGCICDVDPLLYEADSEPGRQQRRHIDLLIGRGPEPHTRGVCVEAQDAGILTNAKMSVAHVSYGFFSPSLSLACVYKRRPAGVARVEPVGVLEGFIERVATDNRVGTEREPGGILSNGMKTDPRI